MRKQMIDAILPKTRQLLLSAIFLQPRKWWYLSSLAKHLDMTPSSLQRDLLAFVEVDLLLTRRDGNRLYYKANLDAPGAEDLQRLMIKTVGVADILKKMLVKFDPDIDCAFIFGSLARGGEISSSDVDILIVGQIKLSDLSDELLKCEQKLDREISVTIFSREEFENKLTKSDGFIKTILADKKIFLRGNASMLEETLAKKR